MADISAADLPDFSIVVGVRNVNHEVVFIKNWPTATAGWRGSDGGYHPDWSVDEHLAAGGSVLRVGDGAS